MTTAPHSCKLSTTVETKKASSLLEQPDFRSRVRALDGLRGVAILAVFFFHYAGGTLKQAHSLLVGAISMAISFGWSGVDLFFVLSGFLITGILFDTRNKPRYYKNFYARRVLRIFPAYYLLVAIYLLLTPYLHLHWEPGHLFFLVYLGYPAVIAWPYLKLVSSVVVVTHLWSLCAEEQFYLIWPWMIAKLKNPRAILWACAALGAGALLLRTGILVSRWVDPDWAYGSLPCRIDTLALGAALAVLVRSPWYAWMRKWATTVFFVAAGVLAVICAARHSVERDDFVMATIGYSVIAIAYGGLLLLSLGRGFWPDYVLSSTVLRLFGRCSYGMYLFHLPLAGLLHPMKDYFITATHSFLAGSTIYLTSALVINLVVAGLSFQLFESPILRLKARFQS